MKIFIILSFAMAAIAQTNSRTGTLGGVISSTPAGAVFNGRMDFFEYRAGDWRLGHRRALLG